MIFEFSGCQGDIVQQGQGVSGGNTLLLRRLQNLTLRLKRERLVYMVCGRLLTKDGTKGAYFIQILHGFCHRKMIKQNEME